MIQISEFFTGIIIVNAVALALLVGFAAVELTRFLSARRTNGTDDRRAVRPTPARRTAGWGITASHSASPTRG